jgi:hypothetical protein
MSSRRKRLGIVVYITLVCGAPASAQTVLPGPPPGQAPTPPMTTAPPRDRAPVRTTGTGVIRGRVIDGVTGKPIARARVRAMASPPREPVFTDDAGAFELTALPPGVYALSVEKSTFLASQLPESGRSVRSRGTPLVLKDAQVIEDVTIPLFHGGAIAGRVMDAHGDPIEYANVQALWMPRSGAGRPTMRGNAQTNDLGEFRVPRLQPGRYLIRVRPQPLSMMDPNIAPTSVIPQPVPTYYPNVLGPEQAQAVVVNRGETISGVEITLAEGTMSIVSGIVQSSDGSQIAGGSVQARSLISEVAGGFDTAGGSAIRPDGTFRLTLPAGDYLLEAQSAPRTPDGNFRPEQQNFGTTRISVAGAPIEGVSIVLGRGATASGRITFEGTTPVPAAPASSVRVPIMNAEGGMCRQAQATIAPDWTFKIEGLGGFCSATPQSMFGRWSLKAVMFRGENLMEQSIFFDAGQQYTNLQVVVTDKRTQIDFNVTDDSGQATAEFVALVFPVNKEKWTQPARIRFYTPPPPMLVQAARSGQVGPALLNAFGGNTPQGPPPQRILGMAAAEYFAIAVDDIENEDGHDPAVLEKLIPNAVRFTLTDDAPVTLPLRVYRLADLIR